MGKSSSSPPPAPAAPDYKGAAEATAAGNKEAALATTEANRVNQYTPYGNLIYSQYGTSANGNPLWRADTQLSSAEQQKLDANNNLSLGLLGTAQQGLGQVNQMLSNTGLDESKLAQNPLNPGESYMDASMRYMEPTFRNQTNQTQQMLANQGLQPGSEAYANAMRDLADNQNRTSLQATMTGMDKNMAYRQQGIQEQRNTQDRPLNIINALRTGNQVTNPQFASVPQQGYVAGPDFLGAANSGYNAAMNGYNSQLDQYNAQQASNDKLMSGLFGLGASAITKWSDRRLKRNIQKIGTHKLGIGIYSFDYVWGEPSVGVMADEVETVMPDAVMTHSSGYKMVDYARI